MKKVILCVFACIVISVAIFAAPYYAILPFRQETIYIAVVGPMSGPYSNSGRAMLEGINLYLDQLGREGRGLPGKDIKLLIYDDQGDNRIAAEVARKIAAERKALLVLGHSWSGPSIAAGNIYRQEEIPAITASATAEAVTHGNDWYFRIVQNNLFQGQFLASYLVRTLRQTCASIVFYDDAYGVSLAQSFTDTARTIGLNVREKWSYTLDAPDRAERIREIAHELASMNDLGALMLIIDYPDAGAILSALREADRAPVIVMPEVSLSFLLDELKNQGLPLSLADGIYTNAPFLNELGNELAYEFGRTYQQLYHKLPDWEVAGYYDAMHMAFEAIRRADIRGAGYIRTDRQQVKRILETFSSPERSIRGATGTLYFDANGDVWKPYVIGMVQQQTLMPAFTQYQEILRPDKEENLFAKALRGEVIVINNVIMENIDIVHTGIDVREIRNIDMQSSTYVITFDLWFVFQGEFDARRLEFTNAVVPITLDAPLFEQTIDGVTTQLYQATAVFKGEFDIRAYPLTRQVLPIRFRHEARTLEDLILVYDRAGRPPSLSKEFPAPSSIRISDPGWQFKEFDVRHEVVTNISTLGNPNYFDLPRVMNYSQMNAVISLGQTDIHGILVKSPFLLAITASLLCAVFIPADWLKLRVLSCAIAFVNLGIVSIIFNRRFDVEYLTLTEYGIFALYAVIIFIMIWVISAHTFYEEKMALLRKIQIFDGFPKKILAKMSKKMRVFYVRKPDQFIIQQGDQGNSLFGIVKGEVKVVVEQDDGSQQEIERLSAGTYFGERALLTDELRVASVITITPVVACELTRDLLTPFLEKYPEVLTIMTEELSRRKISWYAITWLNRLMSKSSKKKGQTKR